MRVRGGACAAYQTPATIDDPAILDEIEIALLAKGFAKEREEP
jgi:hypothetical protein